MEEVYPFESADSSIIQSDSSNACYLDQDMLEQLFAKNNLMPRLCEEFETGEGSDKIKKIIENNDLDFTFAINFLAHMALRKQVIPSTLVGCLLPLTKFNIESCVKQIEACILADLADYYKQNNRIIVKFTISDDVQEQLELYQYQLPMVIPPIEVTHNQETGYLSYKSFIVANRDPDNKDYNLDVINLLNSVPLQIDTVTATSIQNTWKNCCQKEGESEADYQKKLKALNKYNKHANSIIQHYSNSNFTCYLVHKYDKRGRIYTRAYYLDTQGNSWNKAALCLNPEPINAK